MGKEDCDKLTMTGYGFRINDFDYDPLCPEHLNRLKRFIEKAPKLNKVCENYFAEHGIEYPNVYDYISAASTVGHERDGIANLLAVAMSETYGMRFYAAEVEGGDCVLTNSNDYGFLTGKAVDAFLDALKTFCKPERRTSEFRNRLMYFTVSYDA